MLKVKQVDQLMNFHHLKKTFYLLFTIKRRRLSILFMFSPSLKYFPNIFIYLMLQMIHILSSVSTPLFCEPEWLLFVVNAAVTKVLARSFHLFILLQQPRFLT
jgi:hypothetical protein